MMLMTWLIFLMDEELASGGILDNSPADFCYRDPYQNGSPFVERVLLQYALSLLFHCSFNFLSLYASCSFTAQLSKTAFNERVKSGGRTYAIVTSNSSNTTSKMSLGLCAFTGIRLIAITYCFSTLHTLGSSKPPRFDLWRCSIFTIHAKA
jgi:hypothetical protein